MKEKNLIPLKGYCDADKIEQPYSQEVPLKNSFMDSRKGDFGRNGLSELLATELFFVA
jgi:hypothetical protein